MVSIAAAVIQSKASVELSHSIVESNDTENEQYCQDLIFSLGTWFKTNLEY